MKSSKNKAKRALEPEKAERHEKVRFNVIVTPEELAMYKAAAASVFQTMSVWARDALRKAAEKVGR